MNNYEKIMLALFAIQRNAYIIQQEIDETRYQIVQQVNIKNCRTR